MNEKKDKFNFLVFIQVLILCITVNGVGKLYIGEVVALLYILFNTIRFNPNMYKGLLLIALWAFSQFLSDRLNITPIDSSLKGITAPIFMICSAIFFYHYYVKYDTRIASFFISMTIGAFLLRYITDIALINLNPWKWGLGSTVNACFAVYISYYYKKDVNRALLIFTCIFFVFSNLLSARSVSAMGLISFLVYYLIRKPSVNMYFKRILNSTLGFQRIILALISILFIMNIVFSSLFSSDFYLSKIEDEQARTKTLKQANSKYGVLLGGRSESLIAIQAFLDKPVFGHGSWPLDKNNYIGKYLDIVENVGLDDDGSLEHFAYSIGYIPTHSYLMGSLVWGGVFASFFWLYMLGKIIKILLYYGREVNYFFVFSCVSFLWNILFSPFGFEHRWMSASFVALIFFYENQFIIKDKIKS